MRPILHPALSRTWRDESTLQVGATPEIALVVGGLSRPERAVVEAMTGAADLAALRELAAELGLGRSAADRLTRLLLAAGAIIDGDRLDPGHSAHLASSADPASSNGPASPSRPGSPSRAASSSGRVRASGGTDSAGSCGTTGSRDTTGSRSTTGSAATTGSGGMAGPGGRVDGGGRAGSAGSARSARSTGAAGPGGGRARSAGTAGAAGSADPWRQPDRSSAGLVTRSTDGGVEALAARGRLRVDVHGAGRIGAQIARLLAAAGIGTVAILDGDPVRPADVSPGGHPRHAVGMPRRRSLASLLAADGGEDDWDELGLRAVALHNGATPSRRGGSGARSRAAGQEIRPAARLRIGGTAGEHGRPGAPAPSAPPAHPATPAPPVAPAHPAAEAGPARRDRRGAPAQPGPHAHPAAETNPATPARPAARTRPGTPAQPEPHAHPTPETAPAGQGPQARRGAPAGPKPEARRATRAHPSARVAASALPAQRPARPRTPSVPDLAILAPTAGTGREDAAELLQQGIPHLFATVVELTGVVGPLVIPGRSSCLRCHDLHRTDRDPHWPLVLDQALRRPPPEPACDSALAAVVAGLAATQALAYLDGFAPAAVDGTVEVTLPSGLPRRRSWRPHPRCGCGWAAGAGEAAQWVM